MPRKPMGPLPGGPVEMSNIATTMTTTATASAITAPANATTLKPMGTACGRTQWRTVLDLASGQVYHVPCKG